MNKTIDEIILEKTGLKIKVENAYLLDSKAFQEVRYEGFGASETGALLGVNKWKTSAEVIDEKVSKYSDESIGLQASVRKGKDLEDFVIQKVSKIINLDVSKSMHMYEIPGTRLTVSFDGVTLENGNLIPVEIKTTSFFGSKGYKPDKSQFRELEKLTIPHVDYAEFLDPRLNHEVYINKLADLIGIPSYYLVQVQHQIFAIGADYGYLAVLLEDSWEVAVFKISRNKIIIDALVSVSEMFWELIEAKRNKEAK